MPFVTRVIFLLFISVIAADIPYDQIKKIHVVASNHFDAGFGLGPNCNSDDKSMCKNMAYTVSVVNEYLGSWLPQIVKNGADLQKLNISYVYTTQPWLVWLYTHCSPNVIPSAGSVSISCPDANSVKAFVDAIKAGIVTWHAFPTNAELELMTDATIQAQVQFVHKMDDEFGVPRKTVLSQRDVPGIPAGAIPSLMESGVIAVSVGVNGGSAPPAVPPVFRWKNPADPEQEIYGTWHPGGYGSGGVTDIVYVDGWDTALYTYWRGDNSGPGPVADAVSLFKALATRYPNAQIIFSTFDNYFSDLNRANVVLPIVQAEIGDSWMWGVASDPQKVQMIRAANGVMEDIFTHKHKINSEMLDLSVLFYSKAVEHTWGMDYKSYLNDSTNWNNEDFNKVRNTPPYATLISSWVEQRAYFTEFFKAVNKFEPLADIQMVNNGHWDKVTKTTSTKSKLVAPFETQKCGNWDIEFAQNGGITSLVYVGSSTPITLIGATSPLQYVMTTFTADDMSHFYTTYGYSCVPACPSWFSYDFGKHGLEKARTVHATYTAATATVTQGDGCTFTVSMTMQPNLYGYPANGVVLSLNLTNDSVMMLLNLKGKVATRLPEAHWLSFPIALPKGQSGKWFINKVNQDFEYDNVVVNGSKHFHGHWKGATYKTNFADPSADYKVNLFSLDTGVLSVGSPNPYPIPLDVTPPAAGGIHFNLVNNIWGTNYVQWYPFLGTDGNFGFRFQLQITS